MVELLMIYFGLCIFAIIGKLLNFIGGNSCKNYNFSTQYLDDDCICMCEDDRHS